MLRKMVILFSCMTVLFSVASVETLARDSDGRPGFFQRHKKLKKLLLIGGVGAATGGVGAAIMGNSVAGGAATGAGTRIGLHEAKEKYKEHKNRRR
jgi:hypothetical protein